MISAQKSFLNNLRSKTHASHTQLEQLPVSLSLISKDVNLQQYCNYLKSMYQVIYDTEQNIFPFLKDTIPDLEKRKKAHLLERDLNFLGRNNNGVRNFPLTCKIDTITLPYALGIIYVIEGSTLGGRVILKNIQRVLGFTEEEGASYFAGYKSETSSLWRKFLDVLTEFEAAHNSEKAIISGADFAFSAIYNHLQKKP